MSALTHKCAMRLVRLKAHASLPKGLVLHVTALPPHQVKLPCYLPLKSPCMAVMPAAILQSDLPCSVCTTNSMQVGHLDGAYKLCTHPDAWVA